MTIEVLLIGLGSATVIASMVLAAFWLRNPRPYFTWFLLHLVIGIYGITAVVLLAVLGDLTSAAAAILSSIVAYSLGAASHGHKSPSSAPPSTNPSQKAQE